MGFLRPLALFLAVLVVVHLVVRVALRLAERRRLAREWDLGGRAGDRDAWIAAGMAAYDRSLRRRLVWLTILGPMAALALVLYLVNET